MAKATTTSPRTAAIQISCRGERKYAEVLKVAKAQINIDELGITDIRPRRARTGALLLEILGANGATKADVLAGKLKEIMTGQEEVMISRPEKMADVRVRDIEESISREDLIEKISQVGKCSVEKIKMGAIIKALNGLGTVWLKCLLRLVVGAITQTPRLRVGWTMVRTELMLARALQCFRCLERDHVKAECRATVDRSSGCYRCGKEGHMARLCAAPAFYVICADRGVRSNHRMGGRACNPLPARKRRARAEDPTNRNTRPLA
ncbi:PREDICTED: uncharacterized protein LOC108757453 [Trachymyrmex cornetzi]|uniref:Gag-Pol polyprotein n=1 Tax=Trachymyrmex cornetzi TaxID=471704 RepID=A0A151JN66_9HYME|nr:PREDICTED: uncharacterized protein LOC108757453 [Trachymyrmex cornetzi]KYN27493.1 Gag-Pol polyprotein [Trachymyrmex cornetzi]